VRLELSTDDGRTWSTIDVVANNSEYAWTVPHVSSDFCFVRVVNADDPDQAIQSELFSISQGGGFDPYPNPARSGRGGKVQFVGVMSTGSNPSDAEVTITILTLAGEKVRTLNKTSVDGTVSIEWNLTNEDGEAVAAGPYLVVVKFAGETSVKKLLVL